MQSEIAFTASSFKEKTPMKWEYPCSVCKKTYKTHGWANRHQQKTGHTIHHDLIITDNMLADSKFELTPEINEYLDSLPKEPEIGIPVSKAENRKLTMIGTVGGSMTATISGLMLAAEKKAKEQQK
jgi:hypothetical protein